MIRGIRLLAFGALLHGFAVQAQEAPELQPNHSVGAEVFYQSDADGTEVLRASVDLDAFYRSPQEYLGLRLERAWFNPLGRGWQSRDRVYLRAADHAGTWNWQARIGTDGRAVLGSVNAHDNSRFRKEFFVERDVLETPEGLARGIYYTFAGAAVDLPVDDRSQFTVVGGFQDFTGENQRFHVRANYIHVFDPDRGLSAQLRTRWFRNTDPWEADYYSPRWYVQVLPVLQMRRTTDTGWRFLLAGGLGLQRDAETGWRRASYATAQATGPVSGGWSLTGTLVFTETPTTSGQSYRYVQMSAGVTRAF